MNLENRVRGAQNKRSGAVFEKMISDACVYYKLAGEAFIEKTPEPVHILGRGDRPGTFLCNFASSAQPDYKGTIKGGQAICIEAKHTDSERLEQARVTKEQTEALDKHDALGALCYVMVSFRDFAAYLVPWGVWIHMKELYGRKYITPADVAEYKVAWDARGFMKFMEKVGTEE